MRSSKRSWILAFIIATALLLFTPSSADLHTMTGDGFTATKTITNSANALGSLNGDVATIGGWRGGDTATWTLSNPSFTGTILSVSFTIRMQTTAGSFSNDVMAIQYSNDGSTWFNAQTGVQPPGTLTTYGNYTVTSTFPTMTDLNNAQVRVLYTQNSGPDNPTVGFDAVEMYVTYEGPPRVNLTYPLNYTWQNTTAISFNFTPTSLVSYASCSLFINGTLNASNATPIVNVTNNTIAGSGFMEGDYLWNVTCVDTSGFSGTASNAWIVRVDRTAPAVSLAAPADDAVSSRNLNNFTFSVTDRATVNACILVVGDVQRDSISSPAKGVDINLTATIPIGDHLWYVNCTDENGWTGQSEVRNLSVQITVPVISSKEVSYLQGEYANFTGSNWDDGALVLINVTLPNSTVIALNATGNSSRNIDASMFIGYGYPTGVYDVSAVQSNNSEYNATASFNVLPRPVLLTTDFSEYAQGEQVIITGSGFSPDTTINLSLFFIGGSNQTDVSADSDGGFTYVHELQFTEPLGQHNVSASDYNYSNLNATASVTVTERIARVRTNRSSYGTNETVGITGTYFTSFTSVLLQIYNTLTGRIGPGFPTYTSTDANGGFSYGWFMNSTCSGNYTVLGEDQNDFGVRANTTFIIANTVVSTINSVTSSVAGSPNTPLLSQVSDSDGTLFTMGLGGTLAGYVQFTFIPGIPANATFSQVNVSVEHRRTSNKVETFQFYWHNGTSWIQLTGAGCSGVPPDAETVQTCDLTNTITTSSQANNMIISVNYTRSSGGGGDMEIDYGEASYTWTGDPIGCFNFGDTPQPPTVSAVVMDPAVVVLNAGTTKTVQCNFTITDPDGAAEITSGNITTYTAPSTSASALTNISKYQNSSCLQTGASTYTKSFSCTVDLLYYAMNGTWTCNATGISTDGVASSTRNFTVDPLYALSVTDPMLSFGTVSGGQVSGDVPESIMNYGNQQITVNALGYGQDIGDGNSFNCQNYNISIGAVRYALNNSASYDEKQNLTSTFSSLGLSLNSQTTPSLVSNTTYWQVRVPDGDIDEEQCNGTIVFQVDGS